MGLAPFVWVSTSPRDVATLSRPKEKNKENPKDLKTPLRPRTRRTMLGKNLSLILLEDLSWHLLKWDKKNSKMLPMPNCTQIKPKILTSVTQCTTWIIKGILPTNITNDNQQKPRQVPTSKPLILTILKINF